MSKLKEKNAKIAILAISILGILMSLWAIITFPIAIRMSSEQELSSTVFKYFVIKDNNDLFSNKILAIFLFILLNSMNLVSNGYIIKILWKANPEEISKNKTKIMCLSFTFLGLIIPFILANIDNDNDKKPFEIRYFIAKYFSEMLIIVLSVFLITYLILVSIKTNTLSDLETTKSSIIYVWITTAVILLVIILYYVNLLNITKTQTNKSWKIILSQPLLYIYILCTTIAFILIELLISVFSIVLLLFVCIFTILIYLGVPITSEMIYNHFHILKKLLVAIYECIVDIWTKEKNKF